MPLDHTSLPVAFSKVDAEVSFFLTAFAHMGVKEHARPVPGVVGIGDDAGAWLWFSGFDHNFTPIADDANVFRIHVALVAKNRADVDKFHAQGLKAGATDNGPPGIRAEYSADYYGAFLISPGGHNIEAVYRGTEEPSK